RVRHPLGATERLHRVHATLPELAAANIGLVGQPGGLARQWYARAGEGLHWHRLIGGAVLDLTAHQRGSHGVVPEVDTSHVRLRAHVHRERALWKVEPLRRPPIRGVEEGHRTRRDVEDVAVALRELLEELEIGSLLYGCALDRNRRVDHRWGDHHRNEPVRRIGED